MNAVGIDIGTTTISVSVIDSITGKTVYSQTVESNSFITTEQTFEKIQSVKTIEDKVNKLVYAVLKQYKPISSIGVTGQMHGIVYIDSEGEACSVLYTWQDARADRKTENGNTYCEEIFSLTGYKVPAGYGIATHYYNSCNSLVPKEAVCFSTIHDYIAMRLCHNKKPVMHTSNAASFGLFDINKLRFDTNAVQKLGINPAFLPEVLQSEKVIGYCENIPVSVAIGDNQASFIGSVRDVNNTLLINMGTGSQISVLGRAGTSFPSGEVRPLNSNEYILVGSALCGGRAYACLEKFFRAAFEAYGVKIDSAYDFMNRIAEAAYPPENELITDTSFSGKRIAPDVRGSISNICVDNFTPEQLICSVLKGTVKELYDMYSEISASLPIKPTVLAASGNGFRKCAVWRHIAEDVFGMKVCIPAHKEEAAYGASVFGLAACGMYPSVADAQKIIQYI